MGVKLDTNVARKQKAIYTFRAQGQIYHYINSLESPNITPKYLQLYFFDTDHELQHRSQLSPQLHPTIIQTIMNILSQNPYVQFLHSLKDIDIDEEQNIVIGTNANLDQRMYNAPTTSQVLAIWVEEESASNKTRDIIIHRKSGGRQRILHYYGCYDPLQYPLLFPYGEIGWHRASQLATTSQPPILCRAYYCYLLQIRSTNHSILLHSS
ncbi:hypothetical protein ACSBR2_004375 [Camellia fascicularis]